ncbi:hypothetical protein V6Z11_A04G124100 [Gossypium hirsutum]
MPYYGLIPLRAYAKKLSYFYSVSSAPITDSVFKETLNTKTLPTLPSPLLPLSHLKKADGQSFIAGPGKTFSPSVPSIFLSSKFSAIFFLLSFFSLNRVFFSSLPFLFLDL